MKAILSVALVLGLCGLARAGDGKAEWVGTWKCEYMIGDLQRTASLTIMNDGDKLAGTMSWPDQKEAKLKDVKLKDGNLTFSAERVLGENTFTVEYRFAVDGDKLKAKARWRTGGGRRSSTSRPSARRRTSSSRAVLCATLASAITCGRKAPSFPGRLIESSKNVTRTITARSFVSRLTWARGRCCASDFARSSRAVNPLAAPDLPVQARERDSEEGHDPEPIRQLDHLSTPGGVVAGRDQEWT
jgi:hypothetical protein